MLVQIFNDILRGNPNLEAVKEFDKRLEILLRDLFAVSFSRCSRSLLHVDHLTFALRLAQIKLRLSADEEWDEREFDCLLRGQAAGKSHVDMERLVGAFGESVAGEIVGLGYQPAFKELPGYIAGNLEAWVKLAGVDDPEASIAALWKMEDICKMRVLIA